MPRGQPDFGAYAVKDVSASISDMGEVAARLGSIVTYDKRGDVVDFDNFEEPILKWSTFGAGVEVVRLDSTSVKSASQAVYLETSAAVLGFDAGIRKGYSTILSDQLGIEISFGYLHDQGIFCAQLEKDTGEALTYGVVRVNQATNKLEVLTTGEAYVEVASFADLRRRNFYFYTIKMVIDFATGYYKRLLFSDTEYDISAIPIFSTDTTGYKLISAILYVKNGAAIVCSVYLDDFITTQAEP